MSTFGTSVYTSDLFSSFGMFLYLVTQIGFHSFFGISSHGLLLFGVVSTTSGDELPDRMLLRPIRDIHMYPDYPFQDKGVTDVCFPAVHKFIFLLFIYLVFLYACSSLHAVTVVFPFSLSFGIFLYRVSRRTRYCPLLREFQNAGSRVPGRSLRVRCMARAPVRRTCLA